LGPADARRSVTGPVEGRSIVRSYCLSRRSAALSGAIVAIVLLAACTNDDGDGDAAPAATSTTTTLATTTTTTAEQGVLGAYESFWAGYLQAADPMNPEHPVLTEVATGEQLRQLRSAFLARLSAGEVIRGEVDTAPEVVEVNGDSATVRDCYLDRTGIYDAESGERKDTESGVRHLVTVQLVQESSRWKVAGITREGDGCTPGDAS
jgi:hypothetical protein